FPLEADVKANAAGQDWMGNAFRRLGEGLAAGRAPGGCARPVRSGLRRVVAVLGAGHRDRVRKVVVAPCVAPRDRERRERRDEGDGGQPYGSLNKGRVQRAVWLAAI